jgi:hypothetical protein
MQKGYRYYLSEPVGKNFDPEFKPELARMRLEQAVKKGLFSLT